MKSGHHVAVAALCCFDKPTFFEFLVMDDMPVNVPKNSTCFLDLLRANLSAGLRVSNRENLPALDKAA
jgi:hypothetical protein